MPRKYQRPKFLNNIITQESYEKWLKSKTNSHYQRDKGRGNTTATRAEYKLAIHEAVKECGGKDSYTHEEMDWHLLSTYDNKKSQKEGRAYKIKFSMLPSVDHVGDGTGKADFKICSWRTNDSKSDMTMDEYVELCRKIIKFNG
jgi:hypothetical protein